MASECKLCTLLGAKPCVILENDGTESDHADLHARQLQLIELIDEKPKMVPNGSDTNVRNNGQDVSKGKPTKTVLFTFCRELASSYGKNCGIKCSQCKISIKSRQITTNTAYSMINHACVHLNKDLYACSQCDLKFISRGGICGHLNKIHAKSSNSENYVDLTGSHQNDIMDMVKLCFGNGPDTKLDVTNFGQQKQNKYQSPLLKLAYAFMSKHESGDHIQCHLCPWSIPSYQRGNAASGLVDHARWHLNKPIFTCRLCQYSSITAKRILTHLKNNHRVASSKKNYKDDSDELFEEISAVFEECFGESKKERPPALTKCEVQTCRRQKQIMNRCGPNSLLAERQLRSSDLAHKFHRSGKLQCRICRHQLIVVNAKGTDYVIGPTQHVLSHFNKPVISCSQCSYRCMTKAMIELHVRTKHGVPAKNQYDDRTNEYHSGFMDMLSKCYDWDLEPSTSAGSSQSSSGSQTAKVAILSKAHGNDLKTARQVLALDLCTKHVKDDGKMICRVCDQATKVTQRQRGGSSVVVSAVLFRHALTHMDSRSWSYLCKFCSYKAASRPTILFHLSRAHKNANARDGFEDISDNFHDDIMKILSKCYDWSIEVGEMS